MLYNSDDLTRRILTFPAVKPSKSVSPATLLNSLLSLSSKICKFRSLSPLLTSNKHNAKIAINLIEILQIFLEELRYSNDSREKLPRNVVGPLLDVHVILQKLLFLFHDLTRRDARVWMLVNSGRVAAHLREMVGSMADALNGVVLEEIDVGDEVKDYVMYLIKQGRKKLRFEDELEDVRVLNMMDFMLGQMERKIIPDPNNLKRVMAHLGIQNWSDCNEQVKFLEDEIGSDPGVSSVMSLMVYCRCVVFHGSDPNPDDGVCSGSKMGETRFEYTGCLNPDDFKCPISLEIMVDPVTVSSGQTYDRSSILKWFKSGNLNCPKTGRMLENSDLVPNLALKKVIRLYCLENGIDFPISKHHNKSMKAGGGYLLSLAAEEAVKMAADFLTIKLAMGSTLEKSKAAYEIRLLTKRSEFNRGCFMESGAVPYLLNLLLCRDWTAQENSMAALLNLSKHQQSKSAIVENGGLALLVRVLKSGFKMETRQYAAGALFYLSLVEDYRRMIGDNPDAIPSLVELVRVGGARGKKSALVAIFGLLLAPSHHYRVLQAGLVPLIVELLGAMESPEDLVVDSLAVLSALAERPDGAKAVLHARALNVIMGMLCSSPYECSRLKREHCVSLLLALCTNCGGEVIEVLVKNTSLMGALYSALTEGTSRANKKASSLIRLLHEFSERRSSRSMPHALPRENFIHVW